MPLTLSPAIFIIGPTASGKTGLALKLLKHFSLEIISVDSALVYKDMNIGTAKPSDEELKKAPHRLISFLDPSQIYSAADFRNDALREMKDITSKGNIPLLVGGTMLYYRALEYGLSKLPVANNIVRAGLKLKADKYGWDHLHELLKEIDPASAERIHKNDRQRIQRALEVHEITGKTITQLQEEPQEINFPYKVLKIALIPESREWIRDLAEKRFDQMLERGFLEEVKALYAREDLVSNLPAIKSVGYRQVWEYLDGKIDYDEMRMRAIIATRQLAKRQMTWMRSEKNITPFDAKGYNIEDVINNIEIFLGDGTKNRYARSINM